MTSTNKQVFIPNDPEAMLTAAQCSALAALSEYTIRKWEKSGKFPKHTRRLGRRLYWRKEVVVQWLHDNPQ